MKEVLSVSIDGKFKQYLKLSEVRLLLDMMRDSGEAIEVKISTLPIEAYNIEFGVSK